MKLRSGANRICILLVIAVMIAGLAFPAVCDSAFEKLLDLDFSNNEIHTLTDRGAHEFLAERTTDFQNLTAFVRRKGKTGPAPTDIFTAVIEVSDDALPVKTLYSVFFALALLGVSAHSCFQIRFIHLKDGNK